MADLKTLIKKPTIEVTISKGKIQGKIKNPYIEVEVIKDEKN